MKLRTLALSAALVIISMTVHAQPKTGAAEQSGKGWPYPTPAQRGATGYSPNYAKFDTPSERWDIYVNMLWRKAGAAKFDAEYYDYELSQFLESLPQRERALFKDTSNVATVIKQIRGKAVQLPYRESTSGCLLFLVKHGKDTDLAAADCERKN